jgi:hypothetical protein
MDSAQGREYWTKYLKAKGILRLTQAATKLG